jgi:hypothetical protein
MDTNNAPATSALAMQQLARAEALDRARVVLHARTPFTGSAVEAAAVITVAEYIITGEVDR